MLEAYKQVGFNVPLVVRLEGTEVEEGRKMLAESGVNIISAEGLTDAAKKVVAAAAKRTSPTHDLSQAQRTMTRRRPLSPNTHQRPTATPMSILINKQHAGSSAKASPARSGQFHTKGCLEYGTQDGRRRHAGQAAARPVARPAGVRHGAPKPSKQDRRRRDDDLRAAGRSRPTRFSKRSTPASRSIIAITEGVPVLDMARVYKIVQAIEVGAHRPELPRRHHAGRMQDRHHAGLHPQDGPGRRDEPLAAR